MLHAILAVLFIQVHDALGICLRLEYMSLVKKLVVQFPKVVDLAIQDDPYSPILIREWLMPCVQVNDAEATKSEAGIPVNVKTLIIGTTMPNGISHDTQLGLCDCARGINIDFAHDTTHVTRPAD